MQVVICRDYAEMSSRAAHFISERVMRKPHMVLGLATGETPVGMYAELSRLHREEGLDFSGLTTFNLDEYCGLAHDDPRSYHTFMADNLFSHVNLNPLLVHIPDGAALDADGECARYEALIEAAGGIDLQVLGIGMNGHIGFNEPGTDRNSTTHVVQLARQTVEVNQAKGGYDTLPGSAMSMGIGTIMKAREIVLLASGDGKADIIKNALEGPVTPKTPASILQTHPSVVCFLDAAAASRLSKR